MISVLLVDPDVGAQRRAVALSLADGRRLVGPDNGLLVLAARAGGGIVAAVDIARSPLRLEPVSATFHGRDIFAPVAAHLAAGVALADAGDPLDPGELVTLEVTEPRLEEEGLVAHVRALDRFGNAQLDAGDEHLAGSGLQLGRACTLVLADGSALRVQYARTFADVAAGEPLLYEDAQRRLAVAVSHGDAARRLGLAIDDELRIRAE